MTELKKIYGQVKIYDLLLQAVYFVRIENIFGLRVDAPWFDNESLCYLATDASLSLGSNESESFYAGAYQCGYLTQKSNDTTNVTFLETTEAHIGKSFLACRRLAFNKDGTVNEPKKYAFKLTVGFVHPKTNKETSLQKSWIVGVKECEAEASSSGRSEVVKQNVIFQKLRPLLFET